MDKESKNYFKDISLSNFEDNTFLKIISVIFITLIISIPFNISLVFAYNGELSNLRFNGNLGKSKVLSTTDELNLSVTAKITDAGVTQPLNENNVKISYDGFESDFTTCKNMGGNIFNCIYRTGVKDWGPSKHNIEVKLYDNYFVRLANINDAFFIDTKAPVIEKFIVPEKISTDDFKINYKVRDYACDGCGEFCIGVSKINIKYAGEVIKTVGQLSDCNIEGEINITPATMGLVQGTNDLCIEAVDLYNNINSACDKVYLDYTPPVYDSNAFNIFYKGMPLVFTSSKPLEAKIVFNITDPESGLIETDVSGDFSSLNQKNPEIYKWVNPKCVTTSVGNYTCSWDVTVDSNLAQPKIQINFTDKSGNINYFTKQLDLVFDDVAPIVKSIDSGFINLETNQKFLKENNNITIVIEDAGSGMHTKNLLLNLADLNPALENVQADNCTLEMGNWYCNWNNIEASGKHTNDKINLKIMSLYDDAGIFMDQNLQNSISEQSFVYDNVPPKFFSINITPLGYDMEVLRAGEDIAQITALIYDAHSGISAENVLADFSDFYENESYTNARECVKVNESDYYYKCVWEYSGMLVPQTRVKLNVVVMDDAGNIKDSVADNVYGQIGVSGITSQVVDYWKTNANVFDVNKLNRNFLFMSSTGTVIKVGIGLESKSQAPYVHALNINRNSCRGALVIPNKELEFEAYNVHDRTGEFYIPGKPKSTKYFLINIPQYKENGTIGNATAVRIVCDAEVIQSRSQNSNIYSPNEKVNVSFDVELTDPLFSRPDLRTLDKIVKKESQIENLEKITEMIGKWIKLLKPWCTAMNLVRQIVNSVCMIWKGVSTYIPALTGGSQKCYLDVLKLDKIWFNKGSADQSAVVTYDALDTGKINFNNVLPQSTKNFFSLGYLCDLVICEDCNRFWDDKVGKDMQEFFLKDLNEKVGFADFNSQVSSNIFNPYKSLIVATWCAPPCLTGIQYKLKTYEGILKTYNVCINRQVLRGEDISECDRYLASQTCQQIMGEVWYIFDGMMKKYIVGFTMWAFKEQLIRKFACSPTWMFTKDGTCYVYNIMTTYQWFAQFLKVKGAIEDFQDIKFNDKE